MKIIEKINKLKQQKDAVILAHNYQLPEIQDIADFNGDSLQLSRVAAKQKAKVIVFCGVHFMAETASILSPNKKILIPEENAGCPMANMITAEQLRKLKLKHPRAVTVGYVNTSAAVKAELDLCCTSTNAVKVILSIPKNKEIIFVPDQYLASYAAKVTGRKIIMWHGFCPTHVKILAKDILSQKKEHPEALVLVHPECTPEVIDLADEALSTGGMSNFVAKSPKREFIIGTEIGMLHRLKKDNPKKKFYPATELAVCPNMKRTTLEKVLWSLEDLKDEVKVPNEIRKKALKAINAMLAIG